MAHNTSAPRRGAAKSRTSISSRLHSWVDNHAEAMRFSFTRFWQTPVSSIMTSLVIAIALALPATLSTLLGNVQTISANWAIAGNVTVYLHSHVDDADGAALARELNAHALIASTRFIGRDEALATFRNLSGFGDILDALDENPLPAAIVIKPQSATTSVEKMTALADELNQHEAVATAQVDLQWIQRLNAIIQFVQRGVMMVGILLALAILMIVGNTIRLDIHNRREEIVVIKLIGATDAFVRRPFLYGGLIYGFFGGLLSALLVIVALRFLDAPSSYLASLYGSGFKLVEISVPTIALLILVSCLLGLVGSWFSVGRHLSEIQPK